MVKKLKLTKKERERNRRLFEKIVVALIEPTLLAILFNFSFVPKIIAVIWFAINIFLLFNDKETLATTLLAHLFGIEIP